MAPPQPQISVLVPCFGDAATLDAALESVAAQSFADLEAVVSDDASEDASVEVAESWAARDPRFRVLRSPKNLGMTENWNRALSGAGGRFVAKLDADDLWRPKTLELLRAEFDRTPGLLASFCRVEVEEGGECTVARWPGEAALAAAGLDPAERHVASGRALWLASLGDAQLWHSNAFLVPREELLRLGGFDERWSCASDTALLLRLLGEDRSIAHVPYVGVTYRRRAGSVSDRFERGGWKALEGQLVRLEALARDGRRLGPLPRPARQAWWQAWSDLRRLAADPRVWEGMPPALAKKVRAASAAAAPPPFAVRVEGRLRLAAWQLARALGRRASERTAR